MAIEGVDGLGDVLEGFESGEMALIVEKAPEDIPILAFEGPRNIWGFKAFELYGNFFISGGGYTSSPDTVPCYGDFRKLAELIVGVKFNLEAKAFWDWDITCKGSSGHDFSFDINGRHHYTNEYLSDVENKWELMEFYAEKSLTTWLDIGIGRQILAWGTSESFRLVDVINPLDRRQYGKIDIEDLRLGVTMTRIDVYTGKFSFTGLVTHEARHDKRAVCGSPFHTGSEPVNAHTEDTGWGNHQFMTRLAGQFRGWDASVYLSNSFHNTAYKNIGGHYIYPRVWMFGGICTVAISNFLIKTEAAWFDGVRYSATPEKEKAELKILLGLEYSGFTDTQIVLEMINTRISSFESKMAQAPYIQRRNTLKTALRVEKKLFNETLEILLVAGFSGNDFRDGSFQRLETTYDFTDRVALTTGLILYQGGNAAFHESIKDNDMIYLQMEWRFSS